MKKPLRIPTCWFVPIFLVLVTGASARVDHLMPQPATLEWGEGRLAIDASFHVGITGRSDPTLRAAAEPCAAGTQLAHWNSDRRFSVK